MGVIFGPQLLDIVPEVEAFELIGKLGVMMLVLESGIHIDVTMLKKVRRAWPGAGTHGRRIDRKCD